MKRNLQVGEVLELRGKKAVVKIGLLPMQIDMADLVKIKEKQSLRRWNTDNLSNSKLFLPVIE
jgi:DNA mismatch repair protein MutS2